MLAVEFPYSMSKKQTFLIQEALTRSVIGAFYEVYNALGYGFLEHVYSLALERELIARGHRVGREVGVIIYYKGEELTYQRLDMIVDDVLVVENKSTLELPKANLRQLQSYLHATSLEVGLLLHFGETAKFYRVIATKTWKGG